MKLYPNQTFRCLQRIACALYSVALAFSLPTGIASAAEPEASLDENRHFDARMAFNEGFRRAPVAAQKRAVSQLAEEVSDLAMTYDNTTGVVRSLSSHTTYLSAAKGVDEARDALSVAMDFVKANVEMLGLTSQDLSGYEVTDQVYSKTTGATHVHVRQDA